MACDFIPHTLDALNVFGGGVAQVLKLGSVPCIHILRGAK